MVKVKFPTGDAIATNNAMMIIAEYINNVDDEFNGKDLIVCIKMGDDIIYEVFCFGFSTMGDSLIEKMQKENGKWLRTWWDGKSDCELKYMVTTKDACELVGFCKNMQTVLEG